MKFIVTKRELRLLESMCGSSQKENVLKKPLYFITRGLSPVHSTASTPDVAVLCNGERSQIVKKQNLF